jgi:phosphoribosylformimino-5-aminoimidazole carboxamide ribotide isomerase
MEIIPAIDIRGGRCVSLEQGDYGRETIFAEDPAAMARRWQDAGAPRLHVVDLDGARDGRPVNQEAIRQVLTTVSIPTQLGGGIRDIPTIERYLEAGADRLILGTTAIKDPAILLDALARFRDSIAVAVDARDGIVVTEGWRETSDTPAADLVDQLAEMGVTGIVYTDTLRGSTLTGPNFPAIADLLSHISRLPSSVSLIYAGGVSSLDDLHRLASLGVEAVIVGKALYTGDIDLQQALATLTP